MSRAILLSAMDDLDLRLIAELTKDARKSSAELSRKLNVNETTVRRRIQHLEERGIVTFTAILNPSKLGYNIIAIIALEVNWGKSIRFPSHWRIARTCATYRSAPATMIYLSARGSIRPVS